MATISYATGTSFVSQTSVALSSCAAGQLAIISVGAATVTSSGWTLISAWPSGSTGGVYTKVLTASDITAGAALSSYGSGTVVAYNTANHIDTASVAKSTASNGACTIAASSTGEWLVVAGLGTINTLNEGQSMSGSPTLSFRTGLISDLSEQFPILDSNGAISTTPYTETLSYSNLTLYDAVMFAIGVRATSSGFFAFF